MQAEVGGSPAETELAAETRRAGDGGAWWRRRRRQRVRRCRQKGDKVETEIRVKMEIEGQGRGQGEVMINKYIHNRQMIIR